jgi:very-short-patch-repair endonuclease
MATKRLHSSPWALIRAQHGVISRAQLLGLGYTTGEIRNRVENGRLHRLFRGVYAVGRPDVTRRGWWMAAVLTAGDDSALSDYSGAALYGVHEASLWPIHVSVPPGARRSQRGIVMHPRQLLPSEITEHSGIPVTTVAVVITDLAAHMRRGPLEGVINQADILGLTTPPDLRAALDEMPRRAGRKPLRETLDRRTFRFTRSQLERAFIPLALQAGLPRPETCVVVNGWEVDFYWPELDLVVEADSLTYHRTPQQQETDRRRDQAQAAAETERLRFSHSQIRYEPGYVRALLASVARRQARKVGRELEQVGHG